MEEQILGVIGGLGPMATVHFMKLMIHMTEAQRDQQHIPMLVAQFPQVPDRTAFILDPTMPDPVPPMVRAGQFLARSGAAEIALPCITAHSFHKRMQDALSVPLINGVEETVRYLSGKGIAQVGLMATEGTVRTGLFEKALQEYDIQCICPDETHQQYVTDLIYSDVKAGKEPDIDKLAMARDHLLHRGAEVILLGCTELSVIDKSYIDRSIYLDVLEVLSRCCVQRFGKLKKEYEELLLLQ
ncbi:MAG: aspartate/glutamate racemase family protein [Lachnospiraceae bacterium]|nr:aspartate/glutamate racemase family protein [Lachnospiraceae bacterium]